MKLMKLMKHITILFATLLGITFQAGAITLEECYQLSRENYPLIRQYGLVEKSAQYSFSNAARAYLPQFSFLGQVSYQSAVADFPDDMNAMYKQLGIDFKGLSKDQYKLMLQLTQNIWDGGATKAQKESIEAQEKVSQLSIDKEMDALKSRINQIYFGILVMEANLQINLYADTLLSHNLKMAESGVKNGVILQSDLNNIKVELLTLEQQRIQLGISIKAYRQVLGLMIGKEISPSEIIERPEVEMPDSTNNRTELKLFDAQQEQANAQRLMVNTMVTPRFDLFAQGWYGKPGLNIFDDMLNDQFTWNYIAGIRLQWNIGGFYTRKNRLNSITLSQQSIETQRDTFLWNLGIQQTQLENEIEKMNELKYTDEEIVSLRQEIRKSSESKYRNGIITVTDLLHDITYENNAIQAQTLHELELLKNIYELKATLNQ